MCWGTDEGRMKAARMIVKLVLEAPFTYEGRMEAARRIVELLATAVSSYITYYYYCYSRWMPVMVVF
jgi:hypothetical protein